MVAPGRALPPAADRPLVGYLVAHDGPPAPHGLAYDYVLAGDGLWLAAENAALAVRAPVARCDVRGLPPLGGWCRLRHGPIPGWLWTACASIATAVAEIGAEALFLIVVDAAGHYALHIPPQSASAARVRYTTLAVPLDTTIVLHLHSHHRLPAYFSRTDDRDEQGLGLYGVLGRLGSARPEVALRAGAYGHWLPLCWEEVFMGDRGPFRDASAPGVGSGEDGGEHQDPDAERHGEEGQDDLRD